MQLFLRLAWRNIWRHRRRTLIIVLAMGFTMALMMMYDGLIDGFEDAIYSNAIKVLGGNVQVHATGYASKAEQSPLLPLANDQAVVAAAKSLPEVVGASRRIKTGGMTTNRKGAFAVEILGIEPEEELPVNLVGQNIAEGEFLSASDQDVVVVGKGLADVMALKVGDRFTLAGHDAKNQMRTRTVTVKGIYDLKMPDVEKRSVYMALGEAQSLYGLDGVSTEVVLTLQHLGQEDAVIAALKPRLQNVELASWRTNFPEMVSAIETKGGVMEMFSVIILAIAGIGILNLLLMAVYERTREIGLMGALGLKPFQISILFILEGAMIGIVGAAAGAAMGLAINAISGAAGFDYTQFASMTSYTALINERIYSSLGLEKLPMRVLTVVIISTLAAFYPAREAAMNEPAQSLHYV